MEVKKEFFVENIFVTYGNIYFFISKFKSSTCQIIMKNTLPLYSHLIIFALMLSVLWLANFLWSTVHIPLIQIALAAGLHCAYSFLITTLILCFLDGDQRKKVFSVVCYILLFITVIPFVKVLIHELLPMFGIIFFDDSLPVDLPQFYFRIMRGYFIANLLAMIVVVVYRYFYIKQEKKKLDRDLSTYRDRAMGLKFTSHFLTSIFLTKFGEMLLSDAPKDKTAKRDIIQFLAYLLEVERPDKFKSWAEETEQLYCFVRLLRRHYGEKSILYTEVLYDGVYPAIPAGILFFPLENCLKHAHISAEYPVDFRLIGNEQEIVLTCQNYWSPKDEMHKSETGFEMLRYKLGQMDSETSLAIDRSENNFFVRLQFSLHTNEKTEL